jgi:hypothetical protein
VFPDELHRPRHVAIRTSVDCRAAIPNGVIKCATAATRFPAIMWSSNAAAS